MLGLPRRRGLRLALAGSAIAAVAAIGAPAAASALRDGPDGGGHATGTPRSPSALASASGPQRTARYAVLAYSGIHNTSLVLNPKTGRYDTLPYLSAVPSPDGTRLLLQSSTYPNPVGVQNRDTGAIRWVTGDFGGRAGHWSPDGKSILITALPKDGAYGFAIADATTLNVRFVPLADSEGSNAQGMDMVWAPDGRHVALTLSHNKGESDGEKVIGIRFYDLNGHPVGTIQAGQSLKSTSDFSPDGKLIALSAVNRRAPIQIIDAGTGTVQHTCTATAGSVMVGWYDQQRLVLRSPGGVPTGADALLL